MVVVDNRTITPKVKFETLYNGNVFEYGGVMCMVMGPLENSLGTICCNAVTISHGLPKRFKSDDLITPLNCRLVVEDNGAIWKNDCTEGK